MDARHTFGKILVGLRDLGDPENVTGIVNVLRLLFGGSLLGILVMLGASQLPSSVRSIPFTIGAFLVLIAFGPQKMFSLSPGRFLAWGMGLLVLFIALAGVAYWAGVGLAALASGGLYGPDKSQSIDTNIQTYLWVAIFWLLLGIPHRAYKFKLDRNGEGSAQRAMLGPLVALASALAGTFILILHFGGGPLSQVEIKPLIVGAILAAFFVAPIFKALAKNCWQRGIAGMFSPKPLMACWHETKGELSTAFENYAKKSSPEEEPTPAGKHSAHSRTVTGGVIF